jgi:DNA-binding IclR family transcriptional regulator
VFNQDGRQLAPADLAEHVGIPRPTAFRLVTTLEAQDFVRRDGTHYCLGFRRFVLGTVVKADLAIEREALPFLEALRDATGETTQVGMLDGWQAAGPVDRLPRDLEGSDMATQVVTAAAGI